MSSSCKKDGKCSSCDSDLGEQYMYRNLNGESIFTGFITEKGDIVWIGKDETKYRVLNKQKQEDINFFMNEMKQYD